MGIKTDVGAVLEGLNIVVPANASITDDSPYHMLQHAAGRHVEKDHTLDGNGAQNDNIFQVTGVVQIILLATHITTVTDSTTLSGVKYELYDGTAATDITGTVDASGAVANALLYKKGLLATGLAFLNPTAGLIGEASANKISFEPFFALQKTGDVSTYIRIAFTGDANTDVDVTTELHYVPISSNGLVAAV